MAFFSVIIPLYNKASHVENTIKSVLSQTFTNYEIIIINDGSTDESEAVVLGFNDKKIQIHNQKNQGVSVARNLGIEKSKGKLIVFLDADDFWFPNHLEELANLYHAFPNCGMYCSRYKIKTAENHFQTPNFYGIESSFSGIVEDYFFSNRPFRITWTSCLAMPKEILNKTGGFTPAVTNGQDLELWTKAGIEYPVAITNTITAIYNYNIPNSLAKNSISMMKLMDFDQFKIPEQQNPDLKTFLDIHRFFYAILYKTYGDKSIANKFYHGIDKKNIGLINRLLFHLPKNLLKILYKTKHLLKKISFEFSTYN
ncbi:glycosyltransferase family 2 protein [Flavobacterium sp. W22_SRS_FK3]|uniref:glycosyltransferase family 2 protein n=1 Tax=Flavobacterium sp. W22_SRS_FK3 TaxID=3240275 RepID=UPI003F939848